VRTRRKIYPKIFLRTHITGYDPYLLRDKVVSIFGVGGIGAVLAEILVRVGVGNIVIVDKDIVEEENLNRLGYYVGDIGKPKVDVLSERLLAFRRIMGKNFDVKIEKYYANIFDFPEIDDIIKRSDCVLAALDDIDARLEVNRYAIRHRKVLIDGGASTNGLRGRVTVVKPFIWPCLACYYMPDTMIEQGDLSNLTCNVSLPTTMCIIAAIQADQCLKYLLKKSGLKPLTLISLEEGIKISQIETIKRRPDCPYCAGEIVDQEN